MASFVPHYTKKQLQFRELEGELLALLQKGAGEGTLLRAAEEVRDAQIRAIKEKGAKLAPSEKNAIAMERLQREMERLQAKAMTAVLEEYRERAARLKSPVSIPRAPHRGD